MVLYGVEESDKEEFEERKTEDREKVEEVIRAMGIEQTGEFEVKFRAGKRSGEPEAKPRPLIIKIADEEMRERMFKEARKLARRPDMKSVFVSRDLTWAQREEARKEEKKLREEAERKTEEAKKEGKKGKFLVVGQRGKRRVVWTERVE